MSQLARTIINTLKNIVLYAVLIYGSLVGIEIFYSWFMVSKPKPESVTRTAEATESAEIFLRNNPDYTGLFYPNKFNNLDADLQSLVKKHKFLPLGHALPHSRIVYCNEGAGLLKYTTDRFGFNNDDKVWDADTIDILFIGDAMTQGACVPRSSNVTSMVHRQIGASVINLGSKGNGPDVYYALSKVFIPKARPKQVVILFYANDFAYHPTSAFKEENSDRYLEAYSKPDFQERTSKFYTRLGKRLSDLRINAVTPERKKSSRTLKNIFTLKRLRSALQPYIPPSMTDAEQAIDEAIRQCKSLSKPCRVTVAYVPPSKKWRPGLDRQSNAQIAGLREIVLRYRHTKNATNLEYVALEQVLDSAKTSVYTPNGPHLSRKGHEIIAKELSAALRIRPRYTEEVE